MERAIPEETAATDLTQCEDQPSSFELQNTSTAENNNVDAGVVARQGADCDEADGILSRHTTQTSIVSNGAYQYSAVTVDEVIAEAPEIVNGFLAFSLETDGLLVPQELEVSAQVLQREIIQQYSNVLRCMANELNTEYNHVISNFPISDATFNHFCLVAAEFFSDGIINWQRIAVLFDFGYRLAMRALNELPLVYRIINWIIQFVIRELAPWIAQHGGWRSFEVCYRQTTIVMGCVFVAGVLAGGIVMYLMQKN